MVYSNEEAHDMLEIYFECGSNARAAERLWHERYPNRFSHSYNVFIRLSNRIKNEGIVQPHHNKGKKIRRRVRDDRSADIVASTIIQPHDSLRRRERDSGVSKSTIIRIFQELKFHPYRMILHQALSDNDGQLRLEFCDWFLNQPDGFQRNILWSDESTFKSNAEVNTWNCRYWSEENPHWLREIDNQRIWKVNVWCGIIDNQIVGPIFIEGNLNRFKYVRLLQEELPAKLEDLPLNLRLNMWFQQDGCPSHTALISRNCLNQMFPGRWIGKYGPVNYSPRSPDLTVLDYYLWGRIKDQVYRERPTTRENMIQRIRQAIASLQPDEIRRAVDSFRLRVHACIIQNGRQFEHL